VASTYAGFGLAFILARRAPLQGFARRLQTGRLIRVKKGFSFNNVLLFTLLKQAKSLGRV